MPLIIVGDRLASVVGKVALMTFPLQENSTLRPETQHPSRKVLLPLVNEGASWATHTFPRLRYRPLAPSGPAASESGRSERLTACLVSRPPALSGFTAEHSGATTLRALYHGLAGEF